MRVIYFEPSGKPVATELKQLATSKRDGTPLTSLCADNGVIGSFISHGEYDETVAAFKKIEPKFKDTIAAQAKAVALYHEGPTPLQKLQHENSSKYEACLKAMAEAGFQPSHTTYSIVDDHTSGGQHRKEKVFSVPTVFSARGIATDRIVERAAKNIVSMSLHMGTNMYVAERLANVFRNPYSYAEIQRSIMQNGDMTSSQMDRMFITRPTHDQADAFINCSVGRELIGEEKLELLKQEHEGRISPAELRAQTAALKAASAGPTQSALHRQRTAFAAPKI